MTLLLAFIAMPLGILALGRRLAAKLGGTAPDVWPPVTSFALGYIFFSYYWFVMGLSGLLNLFSVYGFITLACVAIWMERRLLLQNFSNLRGSLGREGISVKILLFLGLACFMFTLARCASSYIEGDSLVYHLFLIKQFVLRQKIWAVPYSEHVYWPLFAEVAFIPGEILKSLALSKFLSFLIYAATAVMAGQYIFKQTQNMKASFFGALLILSAPVFFVHAPSTYNDLCMAFFLLAAFLVYDQTQEKNRDWKRGLFVSGLLAGAAMACKYTALFGVLALSLILLIEWLVVRRHKAMFMRLLCFAGGLLLTGLPYYLRSYLHYGNPVFPFAAGLFNTPFGYDAIDDQVAQQIGARVVAKLSGAGRDGLAFLFLPFNVTFRPQLFLGDKIGFLYLPSLLFLWQAGKRYVRYYAFAVLYLVCWFFLAQISRYLVPVLALLAVPIGMGMSQMEIKSPKLFKIFFPALLLIAGLQCAWAGYHAYKDLYIRPQVSESQSAAQKISAQLSNPEEKVWVIGDDRMYYYDFLPFRDKTFRNFTRYPELPEGGLRYLDEAGIRFVLRVDRRELSPVEDPDVFDAVTHFEKMVQDNAFRVVLEWQGDENRYRLYERV